MKKLGTLRLDANGLSQYKAAIDAAQTQLKTAQLSKGEAAGQSYDWHDNAAFDLAQGDESLAQGGLQRLISLGNEIQIVSRGTDRTVADIGDIVTATVQYSPTDIEDSDYILTANYSDNVEGSLDEPIEVSINSPIGSAIYLKKVGEKFSYDVNGRFFNGTIKTFKQIKELNTENEFKR